MSENIYYLFGAIIMVIAVFGIAIGARNVIAEGRKVWATLRDKYGVENDEVAKTDAELRAPGRLDVLKQEYFGSTLLAKKGVVFRQEFMTRQESILFPWDRIQDFKSEKTDRHIATFSLSGDDGSLEIVQLSWSDDLASQVASLDATGT